MDPANTSSMRNFCFLAALLFCAFAANSYAQNRVYWSAANSETIPLEPASLHAGRVYSPAVGGGDMHVQIDSRYPVTVAMTWADEWNAAMQTRSPCELQLPLREGACHQHDLRVSSSLRTPDDYHLSR